MSDYLARIPLRVQLIAAFVVVVVLVALLVWSEGRKRTDPPAAQPSPSAPYTPAGVPVPSVTSPTPSATATSGSGQHDGHDHPHEEEPTWEANEIRKAHPDDDARARAALDKIVPLWASAPTLIDDPRPKGWIAAWGGLGGTTESFATVSSNEFYRIWGGAIQARVNVADAKIVSARPLWNIGSDSLWRVEVERKLVSIDPASPLNGTEKVTWDIQISQPKAEDDPFRLMNFANPDPANEKPDTYNPTR